MFQTTNQIYNYLYLIYFFLSATIHGDFRCPFLFLFGQFWRACPPTPRLCGALDLRVVLWGVETQRHSWWGTLCVGGKPMFFMTLFHLVREVISMTYVHPLINLGASTVSTCINSPYPDASPEQARKPILDGTKGHMRILLYSVICIFITHLR